MANWGHENKYFNSWCTYKKGHKITRLATKRSLLEASINHQLGRNTASQKALLLLFNFVRCGPLRTTANKEIHFTQSMLREMGCALFFFSCVSERWGEGVGRVAAAAAGGQNEATFLLVHRNRKSYIMK